MEYPYIGKFIGFCDRTVLFFKEREGVVLDGQGTLHGVGDFSRTWRDQKSKNITREYLANTWGEVKSKEHAEFLIELCVNDGISRDSYDPMNKFFSIDCDCGLLFWNNKSAAEWRGQKQITIPEPPQQNTNTPEEDFEMKQKDMVLSINNETGHNVSIDKGDDGNVKITIGKPYVKIDENGYPEFNDGYNYEDCGFTSQALEAYSKRTSAVKTLEKIGYEYKGGELWKPPIGNTPDYIKDDNLKECGDNLIFGAADKCSEWPCMGDVALTILDRKVDVIGVCGEFDWIKYPDGSHATVKASKLKKPKTPEEELRDEIYEIILNSTGQFATETLLEKYNITKK